MREPDVRTSRLAIAGGVAAFLVIGGAGFLLGRTTTPRPQPIAPMVIAAPAPQPSPTPATPSIWGRSEIVTLADRASDAAASGQPLPDLARRAVGQRLDLVVPFGCSGPADSNSSAALRWRYDDDSQALRIHVEPTSWAATDWSLDPGAAASIRGFWIPRPWSSSDACPTQPQPAANGIEPIVLPGQTLAVAQFVNDDRRKAGSPHDVVKRVKAADLDTSKGFVVRLRGRVDRIPGGNGAVRCVQPAGSEQHPVCIVAVSLDEVRVENPASGEVLATWSVDDTRPSGAG